MENVSFEQTDYYSSEMEAERIVSKAELNIRQTRELEHKFNLTGRDSTIYFSAR